MTIPYTRLSNSGENEITRSDQNDESTAVVRIQKDFEIRIPRATALLLPWLRNTGKGDEAAQQVDCIAVLGAAGGIQIDRLDGPIGQLREETRAQLKRKGVSSDEAGRRWMELVRFFNGSRELTISMHKQTDTRRFTIPSFFRRLGVLPRTVGEKVVLFVQDNVLEVWPVSEWNARGREVNRDLPGMSSRVHEMLEERAEEDGSR